MATKNAQLEYEEMCGTIPHDPEILEEDLADFPDEDAESLSIFELRMIHTDEEDHPQTVARETVSDPFTGGFYG